MKKILLWDPRTPANDPMRLTVADEIASAAVRAGVAAAVDPAEHASLVTGGPLDGGGLSEVVIQHGPRNSLLRVMLPASVAAVGAQLGLVAAVRGALAAGSAPTPLTTLTISFDWLMLQGDPAKVGSGRSFGKTNGNLYGIPPFSTEGRASPSARPTAHNGTTIAWIGSWKFQPA